MEKDIEVGDMVEVTLVTEVIVKLPNGDYLLKSIGLNVPKKAIKKIKQTKAS